MAENLNSLVEALRYAANLVDDTTSQIEITHGFLTSNSYYGSVYVPVPMNTHIKVPYVDLQSPDPNEYFSYDAGVMANYFYKNDDMSIAGTNKMVEADGIAKEYQILTADLVDKYSILKNGTIEMETAYYSSSLTFDPSVDDDDTVLPIRELKNRYYTTDSNISISNIDWELYIRTGNSILSSPAGKNLITLYNVNLNEQISGRKISVSIPYSSFDEALAPYVGPDNIIDGDAKLPESLMGKDTNTLTGRDIRNLSFMIPGKQIQLSLTDKKTDEELYQIIDDYLDSSGYLAAYDGDDIFLTHEQALKVAEHMLKKVLSISDEALNF